MKTIFLSSIFIVLFSAFTFAQNEDFNNQPQTLFSPGSRVTGWFIDFSSSLSQFNDVETYMPGFAGGVEMNHNFRVGIATKSFTCSETYLKFGEILDEPVFLNGGYGGIFLEASPIAEKLIHVTFPCIIGGGGAVYLSEKKFSEQDDDESDFHRREKDTSPFFVIEPGVNLEMNLTGFMKIYSGYSYRWISGLNLENTPRKAFNASSFNFGIKFGKF